MAVCFLHRDDYPATIEVLDRLIAGCHGYRTVQLGREIDWDEVISRCPGQTPRAVLDAIRATYRLEQAGTDHRADWWRPFTDYIKTVQPIPARMLVPVGLDLAS